MILTSRVWMESVTTKLSLAVNVTDDYRGREIAGGVEISLEGLDRKAIKNPSGYYLFLDLPDGSYSVLVTGGEYYFDARMDNVKLDELDELYPVVNITLKPIPSYPFPQSATLIRGSVLDSQNKEISGATVRIEKSDIETKTTKRGEFVLYFRGLENYEVVTEDGKKLVKIQGKDPVLTIEHPDYNKEKIRKKEITVGVEEGKTALLSITYP